jgi:hypothetical protein
VGRGRVRSLVPVHQAESDIDAEQPVLLIPKGEHAWDAFAFQNLSDKPDFMQTVHRGLLADVSRWVREFHGQQAQAQAGKNQAHPVDNDK